MAWVIGLKQEVAKTYLGPIFFRYVFVLPVWIMSNILKILQYYFLLRCHLRVNWKKKKKSLSRTEENSKFSSASTAWCTITKLKVSAKTDVFFHMFKRRPKERSGQRAGGVVTILTDGSVSFMREELILHNVTIKSWKEAKYRTH